MRRGVWALVALAALLIAGCAGPASPAPGPTQIPARTPPPQPAPSLPADLPADADRSNVVRQMALLRRGLYLTKAGEVRALPAKYARASWSAGPKAPPTERADPQTDERIHVRLEERPTE